MMAVDNGIAIREIIEVCRIYENCTAWVLGKIGSVIQVKLITAKHVVTDSRGFISINYKKIY